MKQTVDTTHVRTINLRAVLDAIFRENGISRAELARKLHMSKPSMADNVAELLNIGIVREIGEGECAAGGGRKPVLLSFCDNFKYVVAMDFHYQQSYFVLSNLRGTVINEFSIHLTPLNDFEAWITMCINAISMLMASQNIKNQNLAGISVSAPGILNVNTENYIVSSRYGNFNVQIIENRLKAAFEVPILVKNSTNAAALGELYYGAGRGLDDIAYVSCGQGVGSGIIVGKKIYEGKNMAAGEIGYCITSEHLNMPKSSLEDRICIAGVLQEINSAMPDEVRQKLPAEQTGITFAAMIELWKGEDPYIRNLVNRISVELGCAVCNLISTLDCELVIVGGDYLVFEEQMLPVLNAIVRKNCFLPVPVVASRLCGKGASLGLVAICRELYFNQVCERKSEGTHESRA